MDAITGLGRTFSDGLSRARNRLKRSAYSNHGQTFLHGHLLLDVIEAKNLPDMESWISKIADKFDVTDSYVKVHLGKPKIAHTSIINNTLNPVWNESYRIEVCHFANELKFGIADKDHAVSEYIGKVVIQTSSLLSGEAIEGWFPILKANQKPNGDSQLHIKVQYISRESVQKSYEVHSYFPAQKNCLVTLYQDAHALDAEQMPQFDAMAKQMPHLSAEQVLPPSCWKELYNALMGAEHLICITGWSVWCALKLFRGIDSEIDHRTLGEILVEKANNGVSVYVMIWSEFTNSNLNISVMNTHDEETVAFFKDTNVTCVSVTRDMNVDEFSDVYNTGFSNISYSHHQKSVICDAKGEKDGKRRLIAFVGGLDLTGGRYDTPNHELFSTLLTEHEGDFLNNNADIPANQGPREPWHDIHSKVEGPIAYDVFRNFRERWSKQGSAHAQLAEINSDVIDVHCTAPITNPISQWNCQLFRSITSDSVHFEQSESEHLNSKRGRQVDSSIASAYIQMIRNAENFIYIENQYFFGSSYAWLECEDVNCYHTIPSEITEKIRQKIIADERFVAYIVVPMFPEGDPKTPAIQELLFWQHKTMEMMYRRIGETLKAKGSTTFPTDWLIFLCLGKREAAGPHLDQLAEATDPQAKIFRQSLRFPIYVHSKMMIIDDVYIILGSANINQRSLSGTRDTEIAVGCWQPNFLDVNPFGDIHRFRMSLWTEHFRDCHSEFIHPESLKCAERVRKCAESNWQMYIGPVGSVTEGQIVPYPINVKKGGKIKGLEGCKTFPDFPVGSKIIGAMSGFLPQKLTT